MGRKWGAESGGWVGMTPGAWGLGGSEGAPRWGGSRPGVAARVGGEACGQLLAVAGAPWAAEHGGKVVPGLGRLRGPGPPIGRAWCRDPRVGNSATRAGGGGDASTWVRWAMPGMERPVLPPPKG